MNLKGFRGAVALLIIILAAGAKASADPAATPPNTGSELPQMGIMPGIVYGTYGPQVKLNPPDFESIPDAIYLDKALEAQLNENPLHVNETTLLYNPLIKKGNETTQEVLDVNIDTIKELSQGALKQCQDAGYLCDAFVSSKDETLSVELTPLTVESVQIQSEDWQRRVLIHLLRGIKVNEPLKLRAVQEQLRLIQNNPDLNFKSELEVIPFSHQVKVKVTTGETKSPFHLVASASNLDQISFGRGLGSLTGVLNNVTGHGDSLMIAPAQGYRSTAIYTHYEIPITPKFIPFLDYQFVHASPYDIHYTGFDTHGDASRFTAGMKYILFDRHNHRLSSDLAFDLKQSNTHSGPDPIEREAVRTIRLGFNYDRKWDKTSLSTRHEFAVGLPIFSGSKSTDALLPLNRGGSQFSRYTGFASLNRDLPWGSTGSLSAQWQYTPDALGNFDVGGIGGTFYGRGYREVFLFVDSYAALSAQWKVPAHFIPKGWRLPFADQDLRDSTQLLTFVDYSFGNNSHPVPGADGTDHLLAVGAGIRSQLTKRISARLDVAFPLLREVPFSQGARFHFGLDTVLF